MTDNMTDNDQAVDLDDARDMLRRLSDERYASSLMMAMQGAARRLLTDLITLHDPPKIKVTDHNAGDGPAICVRVKSDQVFVSYSTTLGFYCGGKPLRVALRYNSARDVFESDEPDTTRAPVPGERLPKRSAATTLIAAVVENFPPASKQSGH